MELPTQVQTVSGLILLSVRACLRGMQMRSSLQIGTFSTE